MQNPIDADSISSVTPDVSLESAASRPEIEPAESGWRLLRRWIVAGNPFYPLSAVLVLFGIFLLFGDERLFGAELAQLWFNFGALEGYGLLIVVTTLFLFRRGIHYDTLMLVVLATLPILVPFILISQAAFLGGGLMAVFCGTAAVAGLIQFVTLRRGIPELPLRGGMAGFFVMIVVVNVALPIVIKQLHTHADAIRWALQMDHYGHLAWNLVLPMLAFAGFVVRLAPPKPFGTCSVGWLPLAWMSLLIAGTAAHVASLGYVYSFAWKLTYLYPVVWVGSWLVWWRSREWASSDATQLHERLIALPAFVALLAWLDPSSPALCWVNLMNLVCFGWLQWRQPSNRLISVLLAASLVAWLRTLPLEAAVTLQPGANRLDLILLVVSFATIAVGYWRRTPIWGVLVALAVIHPLQFFWLTATRDWPLVGQLALLAWWFHTFRWDLNAPLAVRLRRMAFGFWWAHSFLWFLHSGGEGKVELTTFALIVAASAASSAWWRARPWEWTYAGLALLAGSLNSLPGLIDQLRRVPSGLLILLGGLLCFALGTVVALWRKRWVGEPAPRRD